MTQRVRQIDRTMIIGFVASTLYGMPPKIIRRFRAEHDTVELKLQDLIAETVIIFLNAPRPSYADQVLATFHDRALKPQKIVKMRELQIPLRRDDHPPSVQRLKRSDVSHMALDEQELVLPVIMSIRMRDESQDIKDLLDLVYRLYKEENTGNTDPSA